MHIIFFNAWILMILTVQLILRQQYTIKINPLQSFIHIYIILYKIYIKLLQKKFDNIFDNIF